MYAFELWDELTGEHDNIWFYRTTTSEGQRVLLLLAADGEELARRQCSNDAGSWAFTSWPRTPLFSTLPADAVKVDMTDEKCAHTMLMLLGA